MQTQKLVKVTPEMVRERYTGTREAQEMERLVTERDYYDVMEPDGFISLREAFNDAYEITHSIKAWNTNAVEF
ncbi:hypothetical protein EFT87_04030 [Schleiferilactobacillus harbinensis]|uniref:hypothetical protein n=1 Tax=Schleiferilactobacillus harbinensis TaxID=304207 RepID=UPI0021A6B989|nr:hypothetical protein [Schleiferilactobacillus harbinensis]MCT2907829.1 hypothetical protein [Schleiferilactobacillus harbinensis]